MYRPQIGQHSRPVYFNDRWWFLNDKGFPGKFTVGQEVKVKNVHATTNAKITAADGYVEFWTSHGEYIGSNFDWKTRTYGPVETISSENC